METLDLVLTVAFGLIALASAFFGKRWNRSQRAGLADVHKRLDEQGEANREDHAALDQRVTQQGEENQQADLEAMGQVRKTEREIGETLAKAERDMEAKADEMVSTLERSLVTVVAKMMPEVREELQRLRDESRREIDSE